MNLPRIFALNTVSSLPCYFIDRFSNRNFSFENVEPTFSVVPIQEVNRNVCNILTINLAAVSSFPPNLLLLSVSQLGQRLTA